MKKINSKEHWQIITETFAATGKYDIMKNINPEDTQPIFMEYKHPLFSQAYDALQLEGPGGVLVGNIRYAPPDLTSTSKQDFRLPEKIAKEIESDLEKIAEELDCKIECAEVTFYIK